MHTGLRNAAIFTFFVSMAILLLAGYFTKDKVPPIPEKVASGGKVLTTGRPSFAARTFISATA